MEHLSSTLSQFLKSQGRNILLVRSGESISNLAGTLAGWTDTKLSEYGKKQSNLLYEGFHNHFSSFKRIYTSDLIRAKDSLRFATIYSVPFVEDERLREIYFGDHEGEHFDSMPEETKEKINSMDYQAPNGESWDMVKRRVLRFLDEQCKDNGNYLCFTHGGVICTLTYSLGITEVIGNASVVGFKLNNDSMDLDFTWQCPEILNK